MRILHTADVHLKTLGDERWKALDKVVNVCRKENVDLLVISGDLFDTTSDASAYSNTDLYLGWGTFNGTIYIDDILVEDDLAIGSWEQY